MGKGSLANMRIKRRKRDGERRIRIRKDCLVMYKKRNPLVKNKLQWSLIQRLRKRVIKKAIQSYDS